MHVCRRTPKIHAFQQLQLGESHLKSTETYARSARRKLYKLHTYTKGMAASIQNARIKNKPLKKCSSPPNHSPFSYRSPHFAPFFATQAGFAGIQGLTLFSDYKSQCSFRIRLHNAYSITCSGAYNINILQLLLLLPILLTPTPCYSLLLPTKNLCVQFSYVS